MKRTFVRRGFAFGCDRGECAMIRDRDPGAERQRNNHTTRARFHAVFNRSRAANAQIFSFGSAMGATPAATSDGGMPSGPVGEKWTGATDVCSRRVDISMAVKSNAPARQYGAPGTWNECFGSMNHPNTRENKTGPMMKVIER